MAANGGSRRISVGFHGGQVLALRLAESELKKLYAALGDGGWHEIESDEGAVRVHLGQVVYVSADSTDAHVGFG
jgi:hypothetical protein